MRAHSYNVSTLPDKSVGEHGFEIEMVRLRKGLEVWIFIMHVWLSRYLLQSTTVATSLWSSIKLKSFVGTGALSTPCSHWAWGRNWKSFCNYWWHASTPAAVQFCKLQPYNLNKERPNSAGSPCFHVRGRVMTRGDFAPWSAEPCTFFFSCNTKKRCLRACITCPCINVPSVSIRDF